MLNMIYIVVPIICIVGTTIILQKKISKKVLIAISAVYIWLSVFSGFLSNEMVVNYEPVTITALGTHSEQSQGIQVLVEGLKIENGTVNMQPPISGKWISYEAIEGTGITHYGWLPGDKRQTVDITKSITFNIPTGKNRQIIFGSYPWSGQAKIEMDGSVQTIDTYGSENIKTFALADSSQNVLAKKQVQALPSYFEIFGCVLAFILAGLVFISRDKQKNKLERYKFLFDELVKRDFILKYKRTVLGILWSVLSPLFNLLIMWLVFGKMLGSNVNHYAIYLFIGQIVFTYFSEATNQSMTALIDNSSIFTKVNVPKYMFLLSKNVSSLINFSINVGVLFVFILIEGIPITANYLMLIYPLTIMIIFNLGVGLILSALYIFFRDMQYLWGIACQLIMWLSAIFYPIENFPAYGRNLFLLNPLYLFIRYTRKIIIDNTIPSIWFHLLMAGYAITVLVFGAFMYKKYNHEFLYYV